MRPSSAGGASTRAVLVEAHSLTQSSAKSPASRPSAVASSAARVATGDGFWAAGSGDDCSGTSGNRRKRRKRHYPRSRPALRAPWRASAVGSHSAFLLLVRVAAAAFVHAQVLDLAADGVAADAEQLRRLDAAPAGRGERAPDERALELAREAVEDLARAGGDQAVGFGRQPFDPARGRLAPGLVAHLG